MDQRDQELLDKQLRRLNPSSRHDGAMILMLVGIFIAGMTLGNIWFGHQNQPTQIASNDTIAPTMLRNGASPPPMP